MFGKKTKKLGFVGKFKDRREVDTAYSQHALMLGHRHRLLHQAKQGVAEIEAQIESDLKTLLELNEVGMKLPPEAPTTAPLPQAPQPPQPAGA